MERFPRAFVLLLLLCLSANASEPVLEFNRDVRPILSENCYYCHGQDPKHREAKLRLDEVEAATRDLGGYSAIVPGAPDKSEMILRLLSDDKDEVMPPPKSNRHVSPAQIDILKRWIKQGAHYQKHWAFLPPQRAPLPKSQAWALQPIDQFVLARLAREGLAPTKETSPERWLRRVSFDLTGLPPSPPQLDAFAKEVTERGEKAYEAAADTLLASPHFGERMAIDWLDAARYADTHGFNNDSMRSMWRWRDWVIDAFNANLPYDEFITEQLAGDLLPKPTLEQQIATGFSRNHVINSEGGIIDEEYRVEYVADRVRTVSTAWMGLTMECARCHDHKYDAITQRHYYQLFAFFNNVPEYGEEGRVANAAPIMPAPTREQQNTLAQQEREIAELRAQLPPPDPAEIDHALEFARAQIGDDTGVPLLTDALFNDGIVGNAPALAQPAPKITRKELNFTPADGGVFSLWLNPDESNPRDVALITSSNYTGSTMGTNYAGGQDLRLIEGEIEWRESNRFPAYARVVRSEGAHIRPGQWRQVVVQTSPGKTASSVRIFVDGAELKTRAIHDGLDHAASAQSFQIAADTTPQGAPWRGKLDELKFFNRAQTSEGLQARFILEAPENPTQTAVLLTKAPGIKLTQLWEKHLEFRRSLPSTMVMQELPEPRQAFVLTRGNYDAHGEPVSPGVPEELLAPWPAGAPQNRLGLAQWFTQPRHPLTARVVVNRFWAQLFGVGLVKTLEDFGSQSEWPSHPEVLDWLARDFIDGGWNVKALLKSLVLSATYRQGSEVSAALVARDPENRLLARGARVRLPAELIRDQALVISGLLTPQIGGPSVYPYQPDKLYDGVVVGANYPGSKWLESKGSDLYRRSLYTFWKRTVPHPAMLTFDSPDREVCSVRRSRTNTPMQALALWNEPGYLESARQLATRMLKEGGNDDSSRTSFAFQLATGRKPRPSELLVLTRTFSQMRKDFASHEDDARALIKVGASPVDPTLPPAELAAATAIASMILNLDETISKN